MTTPCNLPDKPSEQKFCKDCKHCVTERVSWFDRLFGGKLNYRFARCSKNRSPVDGSPKSDCYCEVERDYDLPDSCGPDGKWFEPKNPITQ